MIILDLYIIEAEIKSRYYTDVHLVCLLMHTHITNHKCIALIAATHQHVWIYIYMVVISESMHLVFDLHDNIPVESIEHLINTFTQHHTHTY